MKLPGKITIAQLKELQKAGHKVLRMKRRAYNIADLLEREKKGKDSAKAEKSTEKTDSRSKGKSGSVGKSGSLAHETRSHTGQVLDTAGGETTP